jgi:hypothetical protein
VIKIDFKEPADDRAWKRWRKDCDKARDDMLREVAKGHPAEVTDLYKRDSVKNGVYFAQDGPFGGKCAYCESYLKHFQHPDIEHFRPKGGVTNEDDVPVLVDYGKGQEEHHGYYWLAYSTANLLPSCEICNQPSSISREKVGKHMRFPVEGKYALRDQDLSDEHPLLINPLEDDPAKDIAFDTATGLAQPKDGSRRGEITIRILGLNVRDQLRERRLGRVREVKALLAEVLLNPDPARRSALVQELSAMRDGRGEYTAMVRATLDELKPVFQVLL